MHYLKKNCKNPLLPPKRIGRVILILSLLFVIHLGVFSQDTTNQNNDTHAKLLDQSLIREYERRISTLEEANKNLENSIDNAKWIGGIILSVIGAMVTLSRYFQEKKEKEKDAREGKILEERLNRIDSRNENISKQNQEYYEKTKENLQAVTEFIGSLKNMLELSASAKTIEENTKILQEKASKALKKQEEDRLLVLKSAITIYKEITKDNYKTSYYKNKLQKFENDLLNSLQEEGDITKYNPYCFFLRALNFNLQMMFKESLDAFDKTIQLISSSQEDYTNLLFDCYFHKAIIFANFSFYDDSNTFFQKCIKLKPAESILRTYFPEVQHFKFLHKRNQLLKKFENNLPPEKVKELKAENDLIREEFVNEKNTLNEKYPDHIKARTLLHIKFGNFYFRPFEESKISSDNYLKRLKNAEDEYREAYELTPDYYLAKLSLNQVLFIKWKKMNKSIKEVDIRKMEPEVISVYQMIRQKLGKTNESKILIQDYYILSICEEILKGIQSKFPTQNFTNEIFLLRKELPQPLEFNSSENEIRIFSPFSKEDLTFEEITQELESNQMA